MLPLSTLATLSSADVTTSSGMPPAAGLRANIDLARISGYIVCNSYRVTQRGQSADRVECYLHRALELLSNWRDNLPPALQLSDDPPFSSDRACCALHMAQGQVSNPQRLAPIP